MQNHGKPGSDALSISCNHFDTACCIIWKSDYVNLNTVFLGVRILVTGKRWALVQETLEKKAGPKRVGWRRTGLSVVLTTGVVAFLGQLFGQSRL